MTPFHIPRFDWLHLLLYITVSTGTLYHVNLLYFANFPWDLDGELLKTTVTLR